MRKIFSVVIPYYQTDPRLLSEAINSIHAQVLPPDIQVLIVVVDDGSPSPAEASLRDISPRPSFETVLLKQENAGVGAARNRALDHLDQIKPKYVAFLDSDDIWLEDHILDAVEQIDNGVDFWFAGSHKSHINNDFKVQRKSKEASVGAKESKTTRFSGKETFSIILRECLPHTSTTVYAFENLNRVRFSSVLKLAGEDHLFWLTIASQSKQVAWTTEKKGVRGEGISIYESNLSWESPKVMQLHLHQTYLRILIAKKFELGPDDFAHNQSVYEESLQKLVFLFFRNFLKMPKIVLRDLRKAGQLIDGFYASLPRVVFRIFKSRIKQM